MRIISVLGLVLVLATACTAQADRQSEAAASAGGPSRQAQPAAFPSASNSSAASSKRPSAEVTPGRSVAGRRFTEITRTDWLNVTIQNLRFCGESDSAVRFRDGSNGFDIPCLMLPRGTKPVYADFLTEEPANAPSTDDALVLVELGNQGAARRQALVSIQMDTDGKALNARSLIEGDEPSASGHKVMSFTSYRVNDAMNHVITTVRTLDGKTETRRYRQKNANGDWERF